MPETPLEVLRRVFGYPEFRGQQQAIVEHVVAGGDAIVLMPTGGGKSLCYQLPALLRPGVGVVVSPLIALMKDQVDALRQAGVRAAALNSGAGARRGGGGRAGDAATGAIDLLYVSPERLAMPHCLELLRRSRIALFAVDEAHCISQWGHDFRRDYQALGILKERFPETPLLALTATADEPDPARHRRAAASRRGAAIRRRLRPAEPVLPGRAEAQCARGFAPLSRRRAHGRRRHRLLPDPAGGRGHGRLAQPARVARRCPTMPGSPAETRARHQERFLREEGVIVVATIAFGMGIDKPNVRFVAHLDAPKNLEAYYQETGRAGRDGLPANAWMTYGLADVMNLLRLIEASDIDERQRRIERQKVEALIGFCETVVVPPPGAARLFRRARPPALRQLRQLPRPGRQLGRHGRGAKGAVGGLSHRPAVRRAAPGRCAGRQRDRPHPPASAMTGSRPLASAPSSTAPAGCRSSASCWRKAICCPTRRGMAGWCWRDGAGEVLRGNREVRLRSDAPRERVAPPQGRRKGRRRRGRSMRRRRACGRRCAPGGSTKRAARNCRPT